MDAMKNEDSERSCLDCDGKLRLIDLPRRPWTSRGGKTYFTPPDAQIWRCDSCDAEVMDPVQQLRIQKVIDQQIIDDESRDIDRMLGLLQRRTGMSPKELAEELGVHWTYLSKIRNGRRAAGTQLVKLIRVYAGEDNSRLRSELARLYGVWSDVSRKSLQSSVVVKRVLKRVNVSFTDTKRTGKTPEFAEYSYVR